MSATEAIQALTGFLHDPDVDLDPKDRDDVLYTIGLLTDYED